MEANLKLFGQGSVKKLAFVLRDFYDQLNLEKTKMQLEMGLNQTWDKIYKPEKYKHSRPEQFFAIEYLPLPPKPMDE